MRRAHPQLTPILGIPWLRIPRFLYPLQLTLVAATR